MKRGEPREGEVHLAGHAPRLIVPEGLDVLGVQEGRVQEAQERGLGMGAGDHDAGLDLLASLEHHSGGAAVAGRDLLDLRAGADLGPEAPRGGGERLAQRSQAPLHEDRGAGAVSTRGGRAQQQVRGGAGGPGAREGPGDSACRDDRAEKVRLEPFGGEVGHGHGPPPQHVLGLDATQHPKAQGHAQERQGIAEAGRPGIGGRHLEDAGENRRDAPESAVEARPGLRVPSGPGRESGGGLCGVAPEPQPSAVGVGSEDARLGLRGLDRNAEVAHDGGAEGARRMGEGRGLEARVDLLGDRRAAHDGAPLENEGFPSGLGEVGRRDEAVVAAADHDDVGLHRLAPPIRP